MLFLQIKCDCKFAVNCHICVLSDLLLIADLRVRMIHSMCMLVIIIIVHVHVYVGSM